MDKICVRLIAPSMAKKICREITSTLPEWFGIPEANERYANGMLERVSFAAFDGDNYVGLIALEFPFTNNANIYWLGVKENYHGMGIGSNFIKEAEKYCRGKGCNSITVETLSQKVEDKNYLKTYQFYEKLNFQPASQAHGEPVNLELPEDITKRELLLTMGEKVLRAIANQDITPTQGKVILVLVEDQKRLVSMQEHDFEMRKILGRT